MRNTDCNRTMIMKTKLYDLSIILTNLRHFGFGVFDSYRTSVGRSKIRTVQIGHRLDRKIDVGVFNKRDEGPALRVHPDAREPRETVQVRRGSCFIIKWKKLIVKS